MTNREVLIDSLKNGGEYHIDACTVDYISCPYYGSECLNPYQYGEFKYKDYCTNCKIEWLDKEWEE